MTFKETSCYLVQGFIGKDEHGNSTSLGREGSDYTASILAYCLDAEMVTVWKDVPGLLNADPKHFPDAELVSRISYREAIELAFYGAKVIHPKTMQPLQNKKIPLIIRSFLDIDSPGSLVEQEVVGDSIGPSFIFKENQLLISIRSGDFSFIVEENLNQIFQQIVSHNIKVNLMQNSALSFSICVDNDKSRTEKLIAALKTNYRVLYNEEVELLTIRHYNQETIQKAIGKREILLEQKTRHTARFVLKE